MNEQPTTNHYEASGGADAGRSGTENARLPYQPPTLTFLGALRVDTTGTVQVAPFPDAGTTYSSNVA